MFHILRFRECLKIKGHFILKRHKSGRKKHSSRLKKDPKELALNHFDQYYEPLFGERWSPIREALLASQKYCALVNNFSDVKGTTVPDLICHGANNILKDAKESKHAEAVYDPTVSPFSLLKKHAAKVNQEANTVNVSGTPNNMNEYDIDLHTFVPTIRMGSAVEEMKLEEEEMNLYRPPQHENMTTRIIEDTPMQFPHYLRVFAFDKGIKKRFPSPKPDENNKLGYYLYDAGSVLPVLALDLFPHCSVLDLCAAPGGKALTILQTLLPESVTCVDNSYSRLQRLRDVIAEYMPSRNVLGDMLNIVRQDGVRFLQESQGTLYDRVLVDAPCNTDRHMLQEEENNMFYPGRLKERLKLPHIQRDLLFAAIKATKPGGVIVYSTCTLSPVQNDGVIQAVLDKLWQQTDMEVAIADTGHMAEIFQDTFSFYEHCRYGQMVLPKLNANFGPSYFSKMIKLS